MAQIMSAVPVPVVLIDLDNRFRFVNHAAEQFLGISASGLSQLRLRDLVPEDNPLFLLVDQVRRSGATVSDHDMSVDSPRLNKRGMTVQGANLPEEPGSVVLVLQDASAARALDRQLAFRGAARSVTGMAAVLAHEVKNPLSGIRGAAQLLETSVDAQDRELAVLIRDEADRIRALVDRMEIFGEKPMPGPRSTSIACSSMCASWHSPASPGMCAFRKCTIRRCRRFGATATSLSRWS